MADQNILENSFLSNVLFFSLSIKLLPYYDFVQQNKNYQLTFFGCILRLNTAKILNINIEN